MKERIPTYDRVQALVRNNHYLTDLDKIKKSQVVTKLINGNRKKRLLTRFEKEENLCKKYNLEMVVTPAFAKKYTREQIEGLQIFCDDPVVSIIPRGKENAKQKIHRVKIEGRVRRIPKLDEADYVLRNGRFLNVEIDLLKDSKNINNKLKQLVKQYKKYIEGDSARDSTTSYNPWKIYDLHNISGLSLLEIARQLDGGNHPRGSRTPAYNPRLWSCYKKVQRAYKKALEMINSVNSKNISPKINKNL